jgi:hypothetical protein
MASEAQVKAVKQRYSGELLKRAGVSGVGVEKDQAGGYVLAIHVDAGDQAVSTQIPETIESVPVQIIASGPFRKIPAVRPAPEFDPLA